MPIVSSLHQELSPRWRLRQTAVHGPRAWDVLVHWGGARLRWAGRDYQYLGDYVRAPDLQSCEHWQPLSFGLRIRAFFCVLSVILFAAMFYEAQVRGGSGNSEFCILFTVDYWAGLGAMTLLNYADSIFAGGSRSVDSNFAEGGFLYILTWTLLEGLILSFFLFFISFFSLIGINIHQRKKVPSNPAQGQPELDKNPQPHLWALSPVRKKLSTNLANLHEWFWS